MLIPAFATHVCLGAPYGWSSISGQLAREGGVVASCSTDWTLDATTWPMAIMIASGGVSAALLGSWTVRVGVRQAMATGAVMFGLGLSVAGLGVSVQSLPLLYTGNVICGLGYGCAYTPPLQTMLDWFPDRRGLASGLVIAGFGSGALAFTPLVQSLCERLATTPQYLGSGLVTSLGPGGELLSSVSGKTCEVVLCTSADLALLPFASLTPGYYLVGSGNTGVAGSLFILAALYTSVIGASAMAIRRPPRSYSIIGQTSSTTFTARAVPPSTVMSTPQYWLLFSTASLLATGGMALMSVASPMMQEVFSPSLPHLVTPTAASAYLMSLAVANLSGRVVWASVTDRIGSRNTFHILCFGSVPLFASLPPLMISAVSESSTGLANFALAGFCVNSFLAVSIMGGVFSCLPPYEAELYGSRWVGAIHGKFLPFSTVRGIAGPAILLALRQKEESSAIQSLLAVVDPQLFADTFGAGVESAPLLLQGGSLTLARLAAIVPPGLVPDPAPLLYASSMYTMAGLALIAGVLHTNIRPVAEKHFVDNKVNL